MFLAGRSRRGSACGGGCRGERSRGRVALAATLDAIVLERPRSRPRKLLKHLCLEKAYDNEPAREEARDREYVAHIRRIGEEKLEPSTAEKRYPARRRRRRRVVERTLGWLRKCRAILVRYEKKASN